jgi:hypothetical protein
VFSKQYTYSSTASKSHQVLSGFVLLNPRYKSNSTGAETAYPIGAHEIIPFLSEVRAVSFNLFFSEQCFVGHC